MRVLAPFAVSWERDEPTLQVAHEAEGAQEAHDKPDPAITPRLEIAENSEIMRFAFSLPHLEQAMGASASDIDRRASKRISQSAHLYSYSGIVLFHPPLSVLRAHCTAV
ncbi:MAG: hypothetical protein V3S14_03395 [Anaerolineae bacterium]